MDGLGDGVPSTLASTCKCLGARVNLAASSARVDCTCKSFCAHAKELQGRLDFCTRTFLEKRFLQISSLAICSVGFARAFRNGPRGTASGSPIEQTARASFLKKRLLQILARTIFACEHARVNLHGPVSEQNTTRANNLHVQRAFAGALLISLKGRQQLAPWKTQREIHHGECKGKSPREI